MRYIIFLLFLFISLGSFSQGGKLIKIKVNKGEPGVAGPSGSNGTNGSVWYEGTGAPAGGTGINGDYYLNDANGDVYLKSGGSWSVVANIKGPTGSTGATGATGPSGSNGTNGTNGTNGSNGVDGSTWYDGTGVPSGGLGINGDYYLNDANGDVYVKASGSWSVTANIKGADGAGSGDVTGVTVTAPITGTSLTGPIPNISIDTTTIKGMASNYDLTLKVDGSGTTGRVPYLSATRTLANTSLYYDNSNIRLGIGAAPNYPLHVAGMALITGLDADITPTPTPFGATKMVIVDGDGLLNTQAIPSSPLTWAELSGDVISWNSTGTFNSGKQVGIGITDATRLLDVNGDTRLRGALYDSGNSAGSSGQVLTSSGTGAWTWTTPSAGSLSGSGTTNYIPKWSSSSALTTSLGYDNGTTFSVGASGSPNSAGMFEALKTYTNTSDVNIVASGNIPMIGWNKTASHRFAIGSGYFSSDRLSLFGASATSSNPTTSIVDFWNTGKVDFKNEVDIASTLRIGESVSEFSFNHHTTNPTDVQFYISLQSGKRFRIQAAAGLSYMDFYTPASGSNRNFSFATSYYNAGDFNLFRSSTAGGTPTTNIFTANTTGFGLGTGSPQRTLHVSGEVRIEDLTTDTPTSWVGSDADGDLANGSVTNGITLASGALGLTGQALAVHNLGTNGLIARTSSGNVSARTITGSSGIVVSDGNGVGNNPNITQSGIYACAMLTSTESLSLTATVVRKLDVDFQAAEKGLINVDLVNNYVEIDEAGTYEVEVSGTFEPNDASATFNIDLYKNGTPTLVRRGALLKQISLAVPFSFSFIVDFIASDYIFPAITCSTTTSGHTMHNLNFTVKRLY